MEGRPTAAGELIGYTDFGWPQLRTVGEFDGQVKYGRLLRPGQEPGDAVFAEKLREDRLRDQGLSVVRWTWSDLARFAPVADRLRRALRPLSGHDAHPGYAMRTLGHAHRVHEGAHREALARQAPALGSFGGSP